ncbi:MAG: transketolase C-terminal domain-containing protein, partial [Candidatus Rokuibacteriota bacterium]
ELGRALQIRAGQDLTLISTGAILPLAVRVADVLASEGTSVRVLSMHTLKPLDVDAVVAAAQETRAVVTLEEHSLIGGLGSAVAEVLAELDQPRVLFRRFGLPSAFADRVGSQEYLRSTYGLSETGVLSALKPFVDAIRR